MSWFDHHCHLEPADVPAVLAAAQAVGVERFVNVGTDESSTIAALAVAGQFLGTVWATAGLHPHEARHGWDWIEPLLVSNTRQPVGGSSRLVAVGECGLDYFYDLSEREIQRSAFAAQIELAHRFDLPLVIHSRDAWDDTFAILDREGIPRRTVFHCFTGGVGEAEACLQRNAFLSFSGIVSFKNAVEVRAAAAHCPLDRLLVETDSPYLAPVPHRGRPNQPAFVAHVGSAVAKAKDLHVDVVQAAAWLATCHLYGLTP